MPSRAIILCLGVLTCVYQGCLGQVPDGPPVNVAVTNTTPFSFSVSWEPPAIPNSVLTSYQVYLNGTDVRQARGDATSLSVDGLSPEQLITVAVSASNVNGEGPRSDPLTVQLDPLRPPENVTVVAVTASTIEMYWQPPIDAVGIVARYTLHLSRNGTVVNLTQVVASPTRYTWTGLAAYTEYSIRIAADYQIMLGPLSNPVPATTSELPPSAVSEVMVNVISNDSASIVWEPPLAPNGILLYYNVSVFSDPANFSMEFSRTPDQLLLVELENLLVPLIPYYVEIVASTAAGEGDRFSFILFTEEGVPPAPNITSVQRSSGAIATVTWGALSPEQATGVLTHYKVAYEERSTCGSIIDDSMILTIEANLSAESYEQRLDGLVPGKEYCIAVSTNTSAGDSGFGDAVKINLPLSVLFQLRLRLLEEDTNCRQWRADNTIKKINDFSSDITQYIANECECTQFTNIFIDQVRIACNDNTTIEAIFQGRIISAEDLSADCALSILQERADLTSLYTVTLDSVEYTVDPYCIVNLTAIGSQECIPLAGSPTVPRPTVTVAVSVVGGVAAAIVVILIVLVCGSLIGCWYVRRNSEEKYSKQADKEDDFTSVDPSLVRTDHSTNTLPRARAARLSQVPVLPSDGYTPGYEAVGQVTYRREDEAVIVQGLHDARDTGGTVDYDEDFELEDDYGYD